MRDSQTVVKLLNNLIEEAVIDGADAGGAYNQNLEGLKAAAKNLLDFLGLLSDYKAIETTDFNTWSKIHIVQRKYYEQT